MFRPPFGSFLPINATKSSTAKEEPRTPSRLTSESESELILAISRPNFVASIYQNRSICDLAVDFTSIQQTTPFATPGSLRIFCQCVVNPPPTSRVAVIYRSTNTVLLNLRGEAAFSLQLECLSRQHAHNSDSPWASLFGGDSLCFVL